MSFEIFFGNGGTALGYALNSSDPNYIGDALALNAGGLSTTLAIGEILGRNIDGTTLDVPVVYVPSGLSGAGGVVGITFSDNGFVFDATNGWNNVKNASIFSTDSTNVILHNFVATDVALLGSFDSSVTIENAKRGNVTTANGNDSVHLALLTNDAGWKNTFAISTGAGNDTITLVPGVAQANATVTDGHQTSVTIDAGSSNDNIDLSGVTLASAKIIGGTGDDVITGSGGHDTFIYNTVAGGNSGQDLITNFNFAEGDTVDLATDLSVVDHLTFGDNTLVILSDDTQINFQNHSDFSTDWFI